MKFVHFASVVIAGAIIAASLPAEAQAHRIRTNNWRKRDRGSGIYKGTPQRFAFELRFGPYYPQVDDEFGGAATPYADVFTNDWRLHLGVEFDWQILRIPFVGTVGPGVSIGHVSATGEAFLAGTYGTDKESRAGETSLTMIPMNLSAVVRFDELFRRTHIPVVPYAKIGLGYGLWWAKVGDKDTKTLNADGSPFAGEGVSYGVHWALGGAIALDFLGRREMSALDQETGVNHIYLFGEWFNQNLGLGTNQMRIGTSTWMTGMTFEM